jgi:predicted nucleic acid-binding protein
MSVVDTNIFVYAADEDSPFHACCRGKIEEWRALATPWYSTWWIMYEFLRVITHPRVFRKPWTAPKACGFVEAILAEPTSGLLVPTERHAEIAAEVIRKSTSLRGNQIYEAQTAILMRENGIRGFIRGTPTSTASTFSSRWIRPRDVSVFGNIKLSEKCARREHLDVRSPLGLFHPKLPRRT